MDVGLIEWHAIRDVHGRTSSWVGVTELNGLRTVKEHYTAPGGCYVMDVVDIEPLPLELDVA